MSMLDHVSYMHVAALLVFSAGWLEIYAMADGNAGSVGSCLCWLSALGERSGRSGLGKRTALLLASCTNAWVYMVGGLRCLSAYNRSFALTLRITRLRGMDTPLCYSQASNREYRSDPWHAS